MAWASLAIMVQPDENDWFWQVVDLDGITVMAGRGDTQRRAIMTAWKAARRRLDRDPEAERASPLGAA